jgi:hypothetical protein
MPIGSQKSPQAYDTLDAAIAAAEAGGPVWAVVSGQLYFVTRQGKAISFS